MSILCHSLAVILRRHIMRLHHTAILLPFLLALLPGNQLWAKSDSSKARTEHYHVFELVDGEARCRSATAGWVERELGVSVSRLWQEPDKSEDGIQFQKVGNFDVTFQGFPPEAIDPFVYALGIWAERINSNLEIRVNVDWVVLPEGQLGFAGGFFTSNFPGAPRPNTAYASALADHLANSDLFPNEADIVGSFSANPQANWYFGTDGKTPAGRLDFVSVVLHEIAHGLGFGDSFDFDGGSGTGSFGLQNGSPTIFDIFVVDGESDSLVDTQVFPNPSVALGEALISNQLFFAGDRAQLGNEGASPRLYAPDPFQPGSSVAHLDETTFPFGTENALMTPTLAAGEANHAPGLITLGIFQDMGWAMSLPDILLNFAQFGTGQTLQFDLVLFNPSPVATATGRAHFWDPDGSQINAAGFLPGGAEFAIPPQGSTTLSTSGAGPLVTGSVVVTSDFPVAGVVRFFLPGAGVAGVGSSVPAPGAIVPVRRVGELSSGVAIRNTGTDPIVVDALLKGEDGQVVAGGDAVINLTGNGRVAQFIQEIFPGANTENFRGTISVRAREGEIAVIGLELEVGASPKFTTLPVQTVK
jgi:hypothetical protein